MTATATAAVSEAVRPPAEVCLADEVCLASTPQEFADLLRQVKQKAGHRTFQPLVNKTAAASGFSSKQVLELFVGDHGSAQAWASVLGMLQRPGRVNRFPEFAALLGPLEASRPWGLVLDPRAALVQFLERLIRLGRRADVARQLAVQRHQLARHAVATAPDRPPGELVVSSARVPRGPDLSRVALTRKVEAIRGRHLVTA